MRIQTTDQSPLLDLPLSSAQLGVWYALKAGASPSSYNLAEYIRIAGTIDLTRFEAALRQVVLEAEALRVRFIEREGEPRQLIGPPPDWSLTAQDVSSASNPLAAARAWMLTDLMLPVDVYNGPLFTFALFRTSAEEFLWYFRGHHLTLDAFGGSLIVRRVAEIYSAPNGSPENPRRQGSITSLVAEDTAYRASPRFAADRQHWLKMMSGYLDPPSLGLGGEPAAADTLRLSSVLASDVFLHASEVGGQMQLTFPQVVTTAAAIFVHRLTEAEDVVLGQMMSVRMSPIARQTPAMMMNIVPLRLRIQPDMRLRDLASEVRRATRANLRHQQYRIAELRRDLRRVDRPIIRQCVSVRPFDQEVYFADALATTVPISNGPVDDLNIHVVNNEATEGAWRLEFDANPAVYDRAYLSRLQARFLTLLASLNPEDSIARLDILPPEERQEIVVTLNRTSAAYRRDQGVEELFEDQARTTPDRSAVRYAGACLSYRKLNDEADRIAAHLSSRGVGPGDLVALHVERSDKMVSALLGILKSGATYVPLDPDYPRDRLTFIFEDCTPRILLTQRNLRDRLAPGNAELLCLEDLLIASADAACADRAGAPRGGDRIAYVLYTSGSTGHPKGVRVPHRALVNFLTAMRREPGITLDDRLLSVTSLSFDIAALELFLPLVVGAEVTIAPRDVVPDGVRLAALLEQCRATIMQATPATWKLLLLAGWPEKVTSLKILCGGEAWTAELAAELLPHCGSLWNMYGPTETTVWSSVARIQSGQPVCIGPPIANTSFYVLDRYDHPVPVGVPGELCIGGDGVASGYLNRPELTAERFAVDPFRDQASSRMYRTGDRVRSLPDRRFEFLGRLDHQVKIRGFRVELGEIESTLRLDSSVRDAAVVALDDRNGGKRLVAYVTARDGDSVTVSSLRAVLRQKLPPYMMPAGFVTLSEFPLTPNGKIDRAALPPPDHETRLAEEIPFVGPRTPVEELIASLWCRTLGLKQVGIHDNFFDLGGDSLAMVRLASEIEQATGRSFQLPWIHIAPTVAGIAEIISGRTPHSGYSPLVLLRPGEQGLPIFMFHPVGGSVHRLIPIARSFRGRQPVYGLQARGFGTDAPLNRVEAMAECYLDAILSVQPRGPYFFVGMCFGGLVALEIANRLSQRGEAIGFLGLLDTYPHPRFWPLRFKVDYLVRRRASETWTALRALKRDEIASFIGSRMSALLRKLVGAAKGTGSIVRVSNSLPPAVKAVLEGGIAALSNYRPSRYPGKVSYLMSGYHAYIPNGPSAVWSDLIDRLEVHLGPREYDEEGQSNSEYVSKWLSDQISVGSEVEDVASCPT